LTCRLMDIVACVGYVLFVSLVADAYLRSGFLIDPQELDHNRLLFAVTYSHLIGWPALILTIAFYLRIRLPLDIKTDAIPVLMNRALLVGYSKKRWLLRVVLLGGLSLAAIFFAQMVAIRVTHHFHQEENIWFIATLTSLFGVWGPATAGMVFISYACVAEKVIRFFPEFERDLLTMNPLPRNY
jgi:hypothetical protein